MSDREAASSFTRRRIVTIIRAAVWGGMIIASGITFACRRTVIGDSEAGRIAEARKAVKAMDLRAIAEDLAGDGGAGRPEMNRDLLRALIQREIRWPELEETIAQALAGNFAAPEIRVFAELQSRPAGRSLIQKTPAFFKEAGPPLQAEVRRALSAEAFARTRLHWDSPIQELTTGPADEYVIADFAFRNEGTRPVRFLSVATSCGCTAAKLEKMVFQPGESGIVRAVLTKRGLAGLREENVFVTTDEPENPSVTLRFRVTIAAPLKITPRLLVWGSGEKTAMKKVTLEVPSGQALDIIGIESVPESFLAQTVLDKENRISLAHLSPRPSARPMAGKFFILVSTGAGRVIRIPVFLRILPPDAPLTGRGELASDDGLWIDTRSEAASGLSHIPGALPLTEEGWDVQFEAFLARWTPGKRIYVIGQTPNQAVPIIQRLKTYGLENIYVCAPGD